MQSEFAMPDSDPALIRRRFRIGVAITCTWYWFSLSESGAKSWGLFTWKFTEGFSGGWHSYENYETLAYRDVEFSDRGIVANGVVTGTLSLTGTALQMVLSKRKTAIAA